MPYQNTILQSKLSRWSRVFALCSCMVGFLVLLGWQFDIDLLKRPVSRLIAMNPLSAVLFICSGASILLLMRSREKQQRSSGGIALAVFILIVAFLKITECIFHYPLQIDTIIFHSRLETDIIGNISNRMAPNTAFNFLLTGITLLILNIDLERKNTFPQFLSLLIFFIGLLSLLGYLYHVQTFYGVLRYIPMAIHTAFTFLLLSLSFLFLNPDKGIMRNFTSNYSGSLSSRFLIPAAIIIPSLLGYLRLLGYWSGLYSTEFGVAILVLSIIIVFFSLIYYNATSINKKDALRKEAEENIKIMNVELGKKVEEQTKEVINREKRFRSMIENASDIISLIDKNNNILYINPAIENISGYTFEEIIRLERHSFLHPGDRELVRANFTNALKNPGTTIRARLRIFHKNGKTIWLEGSMKNMLHDESIGAIVTNYRDITEQKESEEKIAAGERKLLHTLDNLMEGIQIISYDWKYLYVNKSLEKQGKYPEQELIGHTMMEKYPGIEHTELFSTLKVCMNERVSKNFEYEFTFPDGSKGWFDLSVQPVPEGIFVLSIEISERKKAQQEIIELNRDLERKVLERTEQLESVNKELESFSYSVSHDLRAPLRAVNGYAKMIEEDYNNVLDDEGKRLLNIVQYSAQQMGTLIDDLLAFSRLGRKEIQKSDIDVAELLESVLRDISKHSPHHAEIKISNIHNFQADYGLITLVFYNLISNAVKYSSKKEKPVIIISSQIKEREVTYCVSDNGAGFNMKYADKLFGVFQRLHTNDEFEGTGVGLATVQRIISKHGGKVWAEGKVDEGASFCFSLPLN